MEHSASSEDCAWHQKARYRQSIKALCIVGSVCAVLVGFIGLPFAARLAYTRYMPLPVIQRNAAPSYRVEDTHRFMDARLHPRTDAHFYYRLSNHGKIEYSKQGAFDPPWEPDIHNPYAVRSGVSGYSLYKDNQFVATTPVIIRNYDWIDYFQTCLRKTNRQGDVIGNTYIGTETPRCTRTYEGHMRPVPFVWRRNKRVEDLNALVPPSTGYLTHAIDINNRGQILCVAQNTDAKGAEQGFKPGSYRFLILTPLSPNHSKSAVQ